jgi:hypothetical protein
MARLQIEGGNRGNPQRSSPRAGSGAMRAWGGLNGDESGQRSSTTEEEVDIKELAAVAHGLKQAAPDEAAVHGGAI